MSFDAHANLALTSIVAGPVPALSGTSITVATGTGSRFPAAPFNCTIYPPNEQPMVFNAEIVRVTAVVGDVLTIVRAQEGTTAKAIKTGYWIANTITVKAITDIENAIAISAGTQSFQGPFTFQDGGGITFGMSNGTVTAIVSGGGGTGGVAISAGAASQGTGTVVFADANGVTFGLTNGSITASVVPGAANVAFSASGGSSSFQTLEFANSNGITFSNSNGSVVASHNGLTSQSNQAFSASGGSSAFQTLNFANSNGITFSNSNGSVIASHNGITQQSTQPVAVSASNGSFNFSTLNFSNSNGVTFGTSAGGIITASVAPAAGGGFTQSILAFPPVIGNNISSQSYDAINRIVVDPFVANNPIKFNFVQMLCSCNANLTSNPTTSQTAAGTWSIRLGIYSRSVTDSGATDFSNSSLITLVSSILWTAQISTSGSSSSKGVTYQFQTDSTGGATTLTASTNSASLAGVGMTIGIAGRVLFGVPWVASLPAGEYWMARQYTLATAGANNGITNALLMSWLEMTWNGNSTQYYTLGQSEGAGNGNLNGRNMPYPGLGFWTAVTATALPNSMDLTNDIKNTNIGAQGWRIYALKP